MQVVGSLVAGIMIGTCLASMPIWAASWVLPNSVMLPLAALIWLPLVCLSTIGVLRNLG